MNYISLSLSLARSGRANYAQVCRAGTKLALDILKLIADISPHTALNNVYI